MGQHSTKLIEKFIMGEDRSNLQESKGMLNDDTNELNSTNPLDGGDMPEQISPKTPTNVLKLKCDPRSPTDFDRTPIKIPLDGQD